MWHITLFVYSRGRGLYPSVCSNSLGFVVTLLWGVLFQGLSLVAFSKIVCVIPFGRPRLYGVESTQFTETITESRRHLRYIENDTDT